MWGGGGLDLPLKFVIELRNIAKEGNVSPVRNKEFDKKKQNGAHNLIIILLCCLFT